MYRPLGMFALATALALTTAARGQVILNGDFESPALPVNTFLTRADGTTLDNWAAVVPAGRNVVLNNGNAGLPGNGTTPHTGQQYYTFNGGNTTPGGSLSQDFATTVGQIYNVGFFVGRAGGGTGTVGVQARLFNDPAGANTPNASLTGLAPGVMGNYSGYSVNFIAAATTTRLMFSDASTATTAVDPMLDSIVVTVVPEPTSFALGMTALAGWLVRRRRAIVSH